MNTFFALFLAGAFLFTSCTGYKKVPQKMIVPAPDNRSRETADLSFEETYDSGCWVTRPRGGTITILGIAGRRGNREETITEAFADAAHKAALYHGVHGESAVVLNQGSGNLDYFSDFDYRLNLLNNSGNYISDLRFDKDTDIVEKNGSVLVRVQYSGVSDIPAYETVMEDGRPGWVKDYAADVPGFLTTWVIQKTEAPFKKPIRRLTKMRLFRCCPVCRRRLSVRLLMRKGERSPGISQPVQVFWKR
jgi:hypothetical protein